MENNPAIREEIKWNSEIIAGYRDKKGIRGTKDKRIKKTATNNAYAPMGAKRTHIAYARVGCHEKNNNKVTT